VIMIGLFGTCELLSSDMSQHGKLKSSVVSCVGFGFSTSFYQALIFRSIGGATNGNVGVLRTM
jgi:hypothetical protein